MKKLIITIIVLGYLIIPIFKERVDSKLYIYALDIGQGDATLIKTPNDKLILVDTGPSNFVLSEIGEVLPYWQRKIDVLILTHPHLDHISAVKDLIDRYEVEQVIWFNVEYETAIYDWVEAYAKENPDIFSEKYRGEEWVIDSVKFKFIYPEKDTQKTIANVNDASVSFILEYKEFTALFTGDAETNLEAEFAEFLKRVRSKVTYFKAGHHCSDTSNTDKLLEIIRPRIITCSVGKDNQFGHPTKQVLERFHKLGTRTFRTDTDGRIQISTNGVTYDVQSEQ